jgi:hypothetical protein
MRDPLPADRDGHPANQLRRLADTYCERTVREDAEFIVEQTETQAVAVAVLGQFKRGKSTLLNALLDAPILPAGRLPLTGVITRLRYGAKPAAVVEYLDGRSEVVDPAAIANYVTEERNASNRLGVRRVDVELPAQILCNAVLIDTPGIGSTLLHNTQAAHDVVGRIDLALFVTGPEPPITQDEIEFLGKVREFAERVLVVLAKIDHAGEAAGEIISFTRRTVAPVLGSDVQVFAVDSVHGQAHVAELRTAIEQIVVQEGAQVLLRSRCRRINRVGSAIKQHLELRRAALMLPEQERERARARFAELVVEVQERADDLVHAIDRFPNEELQVVDDLLQQLYVAGHEAVAADIAAFAERPADEAERGLYARIAQIEQEWSDLVYSDVRAHVDGREQSIARRTVELESQFLQAGCEVLGLKASSRAPDVAFGKQLAITRMSGSMPTTGLEIVAGSLVNALPRPLRSRVLRRRFIHLVPELLDRARGRVRSAALEFLTNWRYAYRLEVAQRLAEARLVVEKAFAQASLSRDDDYHRIQIQTIESDMRRLQCILEELWGAATQA